MNQKVYWTTFTQPIQILRADLDGMNQEVFHTCDADPDNQYRPCSALAVDGGAGFLYVYDFGRIQRHNTVDNTIPVTIHDTLGYLVAPAMEIDTDTNRLYWFVHDNDNTDTYLYRASAAGGGVIERLLTLQDPFDRRIGVANDMSIDSENNWLYWTEEVADLDEEYFAQFIRRADTTCDPITQCIVTLYDSDDLQIKSGIAADPRSNSLFWMMGEDWFGNAAGTGIHTGSTDGTVTETVGFIGDDLTYSLDLYYPESCAPDSFEPNGVFGSAVAGEIAAVSSGHDIYPRGDEDWFAFALDIDTVYEFEISLTGSGWYTDVVSAVLFSSDGTTTVAQNDVGASDWTRFTYSPNSADTFYLKVSDPSTTYADLLCGRQFEVRVTEIPLPPAPPVETSQPLDYVAPDLGSAVYLTSTNGTLAGSAYAVGSLEQLTVTVDGATFYTTNWAIGTVTDTIWSTPWSPGEGVYTVTTQVSDWSGNIQTDTVATQIVIDGAPPTIDIASTTISSSQTISNSNLFLISGSVDDNVGILHVYVTVDGVSVGSAELDTSSTTRMAATTWSLPMPLANPDNQTLNIEAIVTDVSGQTAIDTQTVTVDIVPPVQPAPQLLVNGVPITQSVLITQANPTIDLAWSAATDGSNSLTYFAGFTGDALADKTLLSAFNTPSTTTSNPPEASIVYAHLVTVDGNGNETITTIGPIYVDSAAAPDLVDDLSYDGWRDTGGSLQSVDQEIGRTSANQLSGLFPTQEFYFGFDADTLRFGWTGANWDTDGDLFIYYSTGGTGATALYDPFGSGNITFPSGFLADGVLHIVDSSIVQLLTYDGANWVVAHTFAADQIKAATTADGAPTFDVLADYGLLGVSSGATLELLAVASENSALKLWASAPDRNPLNSERVINPQAVGRTLDAFQLTQHFTVQLNTTRSATADRFTGSLLEWTVESDAEAIVVGYLASDLLDLLTPGVALDGNGDGDPDVGLPSTITPRPVGVGATINYSVTLTNNGFESVTGVTLEAVGTGLTVATPIAVPTIAAGESVVVTFSAMVTGSDGAELLLTLDDDKHDPFDFIWSLHKVDDDAAVNLSLSSPISFAVPFSQTFGGTVSDASGVASVELEFDDGNGVTNVVCLVADAASGLWSCDVDLGALTGVPTIDVRYRATDVLGNVGGWSAVETLVVDVEVPVVVLSAETITALANNFLAAGENLLSGIVTDNLSPTAVEICIDDGGAAPSCTTQPLSATDGWVLNVDLDSADFVTRTITWQGIDSIGNRSAIFEETVVVDTVAPIITVTNALEEVDPSAMDTIVLSGTVADGSSAITVSIRIEDSNGMVTYETVPVVNGAWSFTLEGAEPDMYSLTVEASDRAGNVSADGVYNVLAIDPTAVDLFSISITPSYAISLTTPLLGGMLLLLSLWLILKTARRRKD